MPFAPDQRLPDYFEVLDPLFREPRFSLSDRPHRHNGVSRRRIVLGGKKVAK
jgi:hypothetical protein